jgi:hypothetical protein
MALPLSSTALVAALPRPSAVLDLTMSLAGRVMQAAASVVALPVRAVALVDSLELLVTRFITVMDRAEELVDRTGTVMGDAEDAVRQIRAITAAAAVAVRDAVEVSAAAGTVVAETELVAGRAAIVIEQAGRTATASGDLLSAYEPALRHAAPMADRFLRQLSHEELDAAVRLVDELPKLTHHLITSVLPILRTLDRVGPDIHDLLAVTKDLKLAIAGIPGLGMLRRRGEDRLAEDATGR